MIVGDWVVRTDNGSAPRGTIGRVESIKQNEHYRIVGRFEERSWAPYCCRPATDAEISSRPLEIGEWIIMQGQTQAKKNEYCTPGHPHCTCRHATPEEYRKAVGVEEPEVEEPEAVVELPPLFFGWIRDPNWWWPKGEVLARNRAHAMTLEPSFERTWANWNENPRVATWENRKLKPLAHPLSLWVNDVEIKEPYTMKRGDAWAVRTRAAQTQEESMTEDKFKVGDWVTPCDTFSTVDKIRKDLGGDGPFQVLETSDRSVRLDKEKYGGCWKVSECLRLATDEEIAGVKKTELKIDDWVIRLPEFRDRGGWEKSCPTPNLAHQITKLAGWCPVFAFSDLCFAHTRFRYATDEEIPKDELLEQSNPDTRELDAEKVEAQLGDHETQLSHLSQHVDVVRVNLEKRIKALEAKPVPELPPLLQSRLPGNDKTYVRVRGDYTDEDGRGFYICKTVAEHKGKQSTYHLYPESMEPIPEEEVFTSADLVAAGIDGYHSARKIWIVNALIIVLSIAFVSGFYILSTTT